MLLDNIVKTTADILTIDSIEQLSKRQKYKYVDYWNMLQAVLSDCLKIVHCHMEKLDMYF